MCAHYTCHLSHIVCCSHAVHMFKYVCECLFLSVFHLSSGAVCRFMLPMLLVEGGSHQGTVSELKDAGTVVFSPHLTH